MKSEEINIEDKILSAAFNMFVTKGFEKATMVDISKSAGINRTVLNYYFRSKEVLFKAVAGKIMAQAFPSIMAILNSDIPFEEKIKVFVDNYIAVVQQNPFIPLYMINEINSKGEKFFEGALQGKRPDPSVFLKQIEEEMDKGNIVRMRPIQVLLHLFSLCVFPILAKPIIKMISGAGEQGYNLIIEERKEEVCRFIIKGLTP